MKVFLAATSLLPVYGGPAFSVSRLAVALTEAGAEVGVWAPDQSAVTTPLLPTQSFVRRMTGEASEALESFGIPDVLHDNGIWLPHNHRLAKLAEKRDIPRLVSTRGMLEPWALNQKRWKKRIAFWLYQRRDLRLACSHHATARGEGENIQRLGLGVHISVIPCGVDVPEGFSSGQRRKLDGKGPRTALFLGRIHPKKGLLMLVEAWARVRPKAWELKIIGPDEVGHRTEVEKAVRTFGLSQSISVGDPIFGERKQRLFFTADLFILPTYSENFGLVVAEALAHGLPVLTTTGTPWSMLPERACGWCVEPTVCGITDGLRQATSHDPDLLRAMGILGHDWVAAEFKWAHVASQFMATYEKLRTCAKYAV
jgi:glycosyltransferase involved in cell wall biosynthesis